MSLKEWKSNEGNKGLRLVHQKQYLKQSYNSQSCQKSVFLKLIYPGTQQHQQQLSRAVIFWAPCVCIESYKPALNFKEPTLHNKIFKCNIVKNIAFGGLDWDMDIESSRKYGKNDANLLLTFVVCDIYKAILDYQKIGKSIQF